MKRWRWPTIGDGPPARSQFSPAVSSSFVLCRRKKMGESAERRASSHKRMQTKQVYACGGHSYRATGVVLMGGSCVRIKLTRRSLPTRSICEQGQRWPIDERLSQLIPVISPSVLAVSSVTVNQPSPVFLSFSFLACVAFFYFDQFIYTLSVTTLLLFVPIPSVGIFSSIFIHI